MWGRKGRRKERGRSRRRGGGRGGVRLGGRDERKWSWRKGNKVEGKEGRWVRKKKGRKGVNTIRYKEGMNKGRERLWKSERKYTKKVKRKEKETCKKWMNEVRKINMKKKGLKNKEVCDIFSAPLRPLAPLPPSMGVFYTFLSYSLIYLFLLCSCYTRGGSCPVCQLLLFSSVELVARKGGKGH